jgi:hypothetical protein
MKKHTENTHWKHTKYPPTGWHLQIGIINGRAKELGSDTLFKYDSEGII